MAFGKSREIKGKARGQRERASAIPGYDYTTAEKRVKTAEALLAKAKSARTAVETEWQRYNDYYNFIHDATGEIKDYIEETGLWAPATSPDPWIQVESQIDPTVPEPEFRGRDEDQDSVKARDREMAVRFIIENNDLAHLNTSNERRLFKLGDAFWKAYWDPEMRTGPHEGDIRIADISPEAVFPDPALRHGNIHEGQYLDYVYALHKVKFWQVYRRRLEKLEIDRADLGGHEYVPTSSLFDLYSAVDDATDTVQVLEHWFRWPEDGEVEDTEGKTIRVEAGDVACSIQAAGAELRLIPRYWNNTHRQCALYPFVHYWRIRNENSFWNRSELFAIMDLVDAQDRKLSMTLLNDAMMANDILIVEQGALADGEELVNAPGATIEVKPNRANGVARLGGVQSAGNATVLLNYLKEQIERTNRNYETNLGKETARQTTATGLAMLREDSGSQNDIKSADRLSGFERLFQLLDWSALEFYDDDRMIFLGADEAAHRKEPVSFIFNSMNYVMTMPEVYDLVTGEKVRDEWMYWPKVDVTVSAGDGVIRGKQATLQALNGLTQANINADNWRLYAAQLEILDIPQKDEIIGEWRQRFSAQVSPTDGPAAGGGGDLTQQGGGRLPQLPQPGFL